MHSSKVYGIQNGYKRNKDRSPPSLPPPVSARNDSNVVLKLEYKNQYMF